MGRAHLRRQIMALIVLVLTAVSIWASTSQQQLTSISQDVQQQLLGDTSPRQALDQLEIKGRAPKTGYARAQFGDGWGQIGGCSVREVILARDLTEAKLDDQCRVQSGILHDPYTGASIIFQRGPETSQAVQIDHVVALSDAWQKGAQQLSLERRVQFANDPLNLLAVDGPANQAKGDADAATWLPPNKGFRCQYVIRQIAVKQRYHLWITEAERDVMKSVVLACELKNN